MRSVPSYVEITGQEVKVLHTYLTNKGAPTMELIGSVLIQHVWGPGIHSQHDGKAKRTSLHSGSCHNTTAMCGIHSDTV